MYDESKEVHKQLSDSDPNASGQNGAVSELFYKKNTIDQELENVQGVDDENSLSIEQNKAADAKVLKRMQK